MQQNKHFTHVTMHRFRNCRVQQTWTAFMRVEACEGLLPGIKAKGSLSIIHKWAVGFSCGLFIGVTLEKKEVKTFFFKSTNYKIKRWVLKYITTQ